MNTVKKLFFVIFILSIKSYLIAQNIQIINIDNNHYPNIGITFELKTDSCLNIDKFSIIENKTRCSYKIDQCLENQQKKLICFVLDEELFNSKETREIIGHLLKYSIKDACRKELLNAVILSTNNQGFRLKPISIEFTDNYSSLKDRYDNILSSEIKESYALSDFFDYAKKYHSFDNNIILISRNDSLETKFQLIKEYADSVNFNFSELHFPISYKDTKDALKNLQKQYSSSNTINSFIDIEQKTKYYKVYYKTGQNNKINFFELHYNHNVIKDFFKRDKGLTKISDAATYKYISLFLFLVIVVLLFLILRNNKKEVDKTKKVANNKAPAKIIQNKANTSSIKPFVIIEINDITNTYELNKLRTNIGRASGNDILIPHLTISNHHATITNEGGVFFIEDNDSTNGVQVNNLKISKQAISPEDVIRLGQATLHLNY